MSCVPTTTTASLLGSATEDTLTTCTSTTTTSSSLGFETKDTSETTTTSSLGFETKDTSATTTTSSSGFETRETSATTTTSSLAFETKDTPATTTSSIFKFGSKGSSDTSFASFRFTTKETSTTTKTPSSISCAGILSSLGMPSDGTSSTRNCLRRSTTPKVEIRPQRWKVDPKPNSESEGPSPSFEDLEVAGTLNLPLVDPEASKTRKNLCQKCTWTWIIREQSMTKAVRGIASEAFKCEQKSFRLCLFSFGFAREVSGSSTPDKTYTSGPMAVIVLAPVKDSVIREFFTEVFCTYKWILDVKLTSGHLLKTFHSGRYPHNKIFRALGKNEYFLLPPELAGRIHCTDDGTLSVICELTLEKTEALSPWLVLEEETVSSEEQEERPRGYHHVKWVPAFPDAKYSWIIRDWPTWKSALSKEMGRDYTMHMWLHSIDFSTQDELRKDSSQEARWVFIGIVPKGLCTENKGFHCKLEVKQIDGTPLKSFPRRPVVLQEDGILRPECFVLPPELALQIHSGNRFSVVCEVALEESEDRVEPSVEAGTQAQVTSGIDGLSRDLEQLLLRGEAEENNVSGDATVRVRGRGFPVHRAILSARTPVFWSMFRHPMSERETGVVEVDDCEPETFRRFLLYAYAGKVEDLSSENAGALYRLADKYQVEGLKEDCLQFLRSGLSVRTVCETVSLAARHGEKELLGLASDFFAKHMKDVILTVEWQNFLVQDPTRANELLVQALHGK